MNIDFTKMTALELAKKIQSGEIKVRQAVDAVYESIDKFDSTYNCYISTCKEKAYKKADEVQARIDSGNIVSALAGVPVSVKDNICTKGIKTTAASKMLENFNPIYNATVVDRMENADMIIVGKLNLDEFAMGNTTETSIFGATNNPWDTSRVPGGSSGGSAVSVAVGEAVISLGSDTGGSISQPCSFCGVTGLKPTYGSVSRHGLIACASSLDQIGPIAKDVVDCAALFEIISGKDVKDGTSMETPKFDYSKILDGDAKGKKIGIPSELLGENIDPQIKEAIQNTAKEFEKLGATVEEFSLPIVKYSVPAYYVITSAEASSNLSRYDGVKFGYSTPNATDLQDLYIKSRSEGFGMEVKRRLLLGNLVLSKDYYESYYEKALQTKRLVQQDLLKALEKYDMLLAPVAPTTAYKKDEALSSPLDMYMGSFCTVMVNLAGLPAVSVPCGFDNNNLPIGMQLIGKPFDETSIMQVAHIFQKTTDFIKTPELIQGVAK